MAKTKNWLAKLSALGLTLSACLLVNARGQDPTIHIDRSLNSPTLMVRFSGAHAAMVELKVNGTSFATRNTDPGPSKGETNFTLDLASLNNGDNDVEVRLYDVNGKLIGDKKGTISPADDSKAPVYLQSPKVGSTVQGPVHVAAAFGKNLQNTYVSFFIDNQFKSMTNSPPFTFIWDTTRDNNGWHEVEAWVVDDSGATYKTKKVKVYVNNPGGNTARIFAQPTPTAAPSAVHETPSLTAASKATMAAKAPLVLLPSVGTPDVEPNRSIGPKPTKILGSGVVFKAAKDLAPSVAARVPASSGASAIAGNTGIGLGIAAGVKGVQYAASVATGPQMLTPTGTRLGRVPNLVAATLKPAVPIAGAQTTRNAPRLQGPIPVAPRPVAVTPTLRTSKAVIPKATTKGLPVLPVVSPAITVAKSMSVPKATRPAKKPPLVKASTKAKIVAITEGTRLPNVGVLPILLDAKPVVFDAVKPRVQNGVPLTPFRYLYEQSGGKVDWHNRTKTVEANGHGREIYIKIGDKLAKINDEAIEMELAPFIEKGRTVVPLSFVEKTLDVKVDFDPATGHVLITSAKKE